MPSAIDNILNSIKKFQAENATMGDENIYDQGLPGVTTSHASCTKNYRESMKVLIKEWKAKVATLKAAGDPKPEYNAALKMQITFMNVQNAFMKCIKTPLHKLKSPGIGDKF